MNIEPIGQNSNHTCLKNRIWLLPSKSLVQALILRADIALSNQNLAWRHLADIQRDLTMCIQSKHLTAKSLWKVCAAKVRAKLIESAKLQSETNVLDSSCSRLAEFTMPDLEELMSFPRNRDHAALHSGIKAGLDFFEDYLMFCSRRLSLKT